MVKLKLDIYSPSNDTVADRPLIVLVHGGGFKEGSRDEPSTVSAAENMAKKGYVVASVDYTLLKKKVTMYCDSSAEFKLKTIGEACTDVAKAVMYLHEYRESFKIDGSKIILFGSSAGAEIILNLAYNKSRVLSEQHQLAMPEIAGVISISGAVLDADNISWHNSVPGIFYHGTSDPIVPYDRNSHHSCSESEPGYLPMYGSKVIMEKLKEVNMSFLFYGYLNREHDIFNLPLDDFQEAFKFIHRVILDRNFYQATIFSNGPFK